MADLDKAGFTFCARAARADLDEALSAHRPELSPLFQCDPVLAARALAKELRSRLVHPEDPLTYMTYGLPIANGLPQPLESFVVTIHGPNMHATFIQVRSDPGLPRCPFHIATAPGPCPVNGNAYFDEEECTDSCLRYGLDGAQQEFEKIRDAIRAGCTITPAKRD